MPANITAAQFIKKLKAHGSPEELKKMQRYFKSGAGECRALKKKAREKPSFASKES